MCTPLRVLIVEDSEEDAQLVIRELRRGGYEPVFERVETRDAMAAAIDAGTWDAIVSDYKMPHFSGTAAFKLYQEKGLDIPFIMVSGTIGEDIAVEAMVAGVHDYVMKNNLPRLVPAITRELKEAEVRRENHLLSDSLKKSEEKYRNIFETATVGIFRSTPEGRLTTVNLALADILGFASPEEMLHEVTNVGSDFWANREERKRYRDLLGEQGEVRNFETRMFRNDRSIIWVSLAAKVFRDADGRPLYHQGAVKEITLRKTAELRLRESEEAMKSLLNATNDVALLMDSKGMIIAANTFMAQRLGREADDLIGQNVFDQFPKDIAHRRRLWVEEAVESGKPVRFEDASADNRYFDSCVYPVLDAEGRVVRLAVYAKDITEAKRARQVLAESEARFKQLFDSVNDGITVRDARTFELLDANRRFCEMFGYTPEELKTLPLGSLSGSESPDERQRHLAAYYEEAKDDVPRLLQWENRRKDGSTFWVERNVRRMTVQGRKCILAVARDITERKKAEEDLKRSEEIALRHAHETAVIAEIGRVISSSLEIKDTYDLFADEVRKLIPFDQAIVNLVNRQEGTLTTAYSAGMEVLERKKGFVFPIAGTVTAEMMRTGTPMLFHLESIEEVRDRFPGLVLSFQAGLRSRLSAPLIFRGEVIGSLALTSKQENVYGEEDLKLVQGVANQIAGAIANAQLFRERKRAEKTLRKSEARYRSLFENMLDAFAYCEMSFDDGRPVDFVYLEVNDAFERLTGLKDVVGKRVSEVIPGIQKAHPELFEIYGQVASTGRPERFDIDLKSLGIWLSISVYSAEKNRFVAVFDNITERKKAEQALKESEKRYRTAIESCNDGVVIASEGRHVYVNQRFLDMFGYDGPEEIIGTSVADARHVHPEDRERIVEVVRRTQAGGAEPSKYEGRAIRKDGRVLHVEASATGIVYQGKPASLSYLRDITERKAAEEMLREYEKVVESSQDMVVVVDRRYRYILANSAFLMYRGLSREDVVGRSAAEILGADVFENAVKKGLDACFRGETVQYEMKHRYPILGERDLFVSYFPIQGSHGVTGVASIIRDITERKRGQDAVKLSEEKYRSLVESSSDAIFMVDTQRTMTSCNQAFCDLFGYEKEEAEHRSMRLLHASDASFEAYGQEAYPMVQKHGTFRAEWDLVRKDCTIVHVESVISAIKGPDGTAKGFAGIIRDITERKRAEERIRAALKEKEVLLKEIHHRVKNNLQIISSLLFLQATRTEHPAAVSALEESRNRIKSMSLIHERLYQSSDFARIDMGEYTRKLVSDLQHSYKIGESAVRLTLNLEGISFDITEAIPCGLIINELVSNALKHAFPKGKEGKITIQLQRGNTNNITLTVSDNGIGFPEHVDFRKSPSLGLTLINSLVDQLEGAIELDQRGGSTFTITFNVSGTDTISTEGTR